MKKITKTILIIVLISSFFSLGNPVYAEEALTIGTNAEGELANNSVDLARNPYRTASSDGRYVAFYSSATNLVSGDTNDAQDVFWKDLQTGTIKRVSVATNGTQANGPSALDAISGNGRYVLFHSTASNIDAADASTDMDLYRYDTQEDELLLVTTEGDAGYLPGWSTTTLISGAIPHYDISDDGRYVLFLSDGAYTESDDNEEYNYYRWDTVEDEYVLIGETPEGDIPDGEYANTGTKGFFVSGTENNTVIFSQIAGSTTHEDHEYNIYRFDFYKYEIDTQTTTYLDTRANLGGNYSIGLWDFFPSLNGRYAFFHVGIDYGVELYRVDLTTDELLLIDTLESPVEDLNYSTSNYYYTAHSIDGNIVETAGLFKKDRSSRWNSKIINVAKNKVLNFSPQGDLYPNEESFWESNGTEAVFPSFSSDGSCFFFTTRTSSLNSSETALTNVSYRICAPTVSLSSNLSAVQDRDFIIQLTPSDPISDLTFDDFSCTNCLIADITKKSDLLYDIKVRAQSAGSMSITLPEASVVSGILQVEDSNTINVTYAPASNLASSRSLSSKSSDQKKGITAEDESSRPEVTTIRAKLLKQGMIGDDVRQLQNFLQTFLERSITIDGIFGRQTKSAVMEFQTKKNLQSDGIVGPLTKAAIES